MQDPFLYGGTLRQNLDPFNEFSDTDLWDALEKVELAAYIRKLTAKLDTEAGEDGRHLSIGQKQLMCLARAMVRGNKILIMDEATANIDFK